MIDFIYNYTGYIHATFLLLVFSYVLWDHLLDRRLIQIVCPKGYIAALGAFFSLLLRENFKYYFADFVRKGGNPPPFTDKIFGKKGVTDLGGAPPPPLTDKIRKVVFEVLP